MPFLGSFRCPGTSTSILPRPEWWVRRYCRHRLGKLRLGHVFVSSFGCVHEPAALHASSVQGLPSSWQLVPALANVQLAVQHAPPSHCSPGSTTPLPHAL